MTTMRYRAIACAACGNHTVLAASGMCLTCVSEPFPPRGRRVELALIYAAGFAIAAAFVLMVLTGHARAQDMPYGKDFEREVMRPNTVVEWFIKPDIVNQVVRDYLRSRGEPVPDGDYELNCWRHMSGRSCQFKAFVPTALPPEVKP